jgi:hypothetical protein
MQLLQFLVILLLAGLLLLTYWMQKIRNKKSVIDTKGNSAPDKEINKFAEFRTLALSVDAESLGITPSSFSRKVWGVLMETGLATGGSFALLVLADGTTSLFISNGTSVIGGGQHEIIRTPSERFLALANQFLEETKPTNDYPLPLKGEVRFYFRTFDGVKTHSAMEADMNKAGDPFSKLLYSGHAIITELRKMVPPPR